MKIQEFSFGNFKSFKDIQTLNLSAAKIKSKREDIDQNNVIKGNNNEGVSFLKSKAIYGANASGKSNIITALIAFFVIVKTSVKDEKILNLVESFRLSTETENEPTFFQIIFWHQNIKYRYGFEADNKNIIAEWLYGKPKDRELPFFIRDRQEILKLDKTNYRDGDKFKTLFGKDSELNEIFRNNSLLLSTLASFGFGKLSKQLIDSFTSITLINGLSVQAMYMYEYAKDSLNDDKKKKYMLDFLKYGDIGIEDIAESNGEMIGVVDEEQSSKKIKIKLLISNKRKFDENLISDETESFHFNEHESQGTKKCLN